MKKENKYLYLINVLFYIYFAILLCERAISVTLTLTNGINPYGSLFNGFVYTTIFVSIIGFIIYLFTKCRTSLTGFKNKDELVEKINFRNLIIASGILLLSGMVHSEYTIPVIQFVSYGFLILAIVFRTVMLFDKSNDKPLLILTVIYLVCFSMAIPVVYPSNINAHVGFHIVEFIASYLLVGSFTWMFVCLFENKINKVLLPLFIVLAFALDASLIALRWNEEINVFLFIFIVLSTILYLVVLVYLRCKKRINTI